MIKTHLWPQNLSPSDPYSTDKQCLFQGDPCRHCLNWETTPWEPLVTHAAGRAEHHVCSTITPKHTPWTQVNKTKAGPLYKTCKVVKEGKHEEEVVEEWPAQTKEDIKITCKFSFWIGHQRQEELSVDSGWNSAHPLVCFGWVCCCFCRLGSSGWLGTHYEAKLNMCPPCLHIPTARLIYIKKQTNKKLTK